MTRCNEQGDTYAAVIALICHFREKRNLVIVCPLHQPMHVERCRLLFKIARSILASMLHENYQRRMFTDQLVSSSKLLLLHGHEALRPLRLGLQNLLQERQYRNGSCTVSALAAFVDAAACCVKKRFLCFSIVLVQHDRLPRHAIWFSSGPQEAPPVKHQAPPSSCTLDPAWETSQPAGAQLVLCWCICIADISKHTSQSLRHCQDLQGRSHVSSI